MQISIQDLSARQAKFCLRTEKLCIQYLSKPRNSHFLLAVSGGADSMALLTLFHILAPRLDIQLSAMHVDHCLRKSSNKDAQFVLEQCENLNIPCVCKKAQISSLALEHHCGLEEMGRRERYAFLHQFKDEIGADYILTGHQAADLSEDIFMRLLRGAGWPALGGMRILNNTIFRPLLYEEPQNLKDFLKDLGFSWREDESNNNLSFRRNRIRHLLMPMLRCENPSLATACKKMNRQAERDRAYWEQEITNALNQNPWLLEESNSFIILTLPSSLLLTLHPALRIRIYRYTFDWLQNKLEFSGECRSEIIEELEKIYVRKIGGKFINLISGLKASYKKGSIIFECQKNVGRLCQNNKSCL